MPKQYLIYDAACPMCRSFVTRLSWLGLTTRDDGIEPVPNTDFDFGEGLNQRINEKLGYEMQLVAPESEKIYSGIDVMLQVLAKIPWLAWLVPILSFSGIYHLVRFFYRLIAYNRKILTPPDPNRISCACDPPERGMDIYRLTLWLILIGVLCIDLALLHYTQREIFSYLYLPAFGLYSLINILFSLLEYRHQKAGRLIEQNAIALTLHTSWFVVLTLLLIGGLMYLPDSKSFQDANTFIFCLLLCGCVAHFVLLLRSAYLRRSAVGMPEKRNRLALCMSILFVLSAPFLGLFLYLLQYQDAFNE